MKELPTWSDAFDAVDRMQRGGETATALEIFIADNEPAGRNACAEFRKQLQAVLDGAKS